jgi:hypothetical protein
MVVPARGVRLLALALGVPLLLLATILLLWAVDEQPKVLPAPQEPAPAERIAIAEPASDTQAPRTSESPAPAPAPGDAEEAQAPTDATRRAAGDHSPEQGSASLRGWLPEGSEVFVARGGVLPLDSPVALTRGDVRRIVVGLDGFHLRGLAPGPLRLCARTRSGARLDLDGLWLLPGETLDLGVLNFAPKAAFDVRVVGEQGLLLREARLAAIGDRPGGAWRALGPEAGSPLPLPDFTGALRFELPAGPWRLLAGAPGHAPLRFEGFAPAETTQVFELVLSAGQTLEGELIDPDGLGVAGRTIAARSLGAHGPSIEQARLDGVPPEALAALSVTATTLEGRFRFTGLQEGDALALRALVESSLEQPDAFAPETRSPVDARRAEVVQRAGASLTFEVVEFGTLEPISSFDARLAGTWPAGAPWKHFEQSSVTWKGLRPIVAARNPLYADLPESDDLVLELEAEGYDLASSPAFRLRTGETTQLFSLPLRPLPRIHVRVTSAVDGAPLGDARCELIAVVPERVVGRGSSVDESDAQGRARLTVPAQNAADLLVRREGYAPFRSRAPAPNLPELPFEAQLGLGGRLRVQVLDEQRRPVRAEVLRRRTPVETGNSLSEEVERVLVDSEGWAEFRDLEPGMTSVAARELPRSDLRLPLSLEALTWVAAGVAAGVTTQVEVPAAAVHSPVVTLTWRGRPLPHAVVRLAPWSAETAQPYRDAERFLGDAALRCDDRGTFVARDLPIGVYSLRVEHPSFSAFARAELSVDGATPAQTIEVAGQRLRGRVMASEELGVWRARVVVWAHPGQWYAGIELERGDSLRSLAPERIVFAENDGEDGTFDLYVPAGIELIVTATDGRQTGDYFLEPLDGRTQVEPLTVYVQGSLELTVRPDVPLGLVDSDKLGLVGLCLDQQWGRGVLAQPLEDGVLNVRDLPRGIWKLRLVTLAAGHIVTGLGDWHEFELDDSQAHVVLPWVADLRPR